MTRDDEIERLRRELEVARGETVLAVEAARAGAVNPHAVARLLSERVRGDVRGGARVVRVLETGDEVDELGTDGEPLSAAALVREARERTPYLFQDEAASTTGPASGRRFTRAELAKLAKEDPEAWREAARAVRAGQAHLAPAS